MIRHTFILALAFATPTQAQQIDPSELTRAVQEASARFAVPPSWIWAVIDVESARRPRAISPKGAMGLMQLMPETWQDLRKAHALGPDVFDVRTNVLAGTAYLKYLLNRYGENGGLAAYNAGPGRYEEYLKHQKPLPAETTAYVIKVQKRAGMDTALPLSEMKTASGPDWKSAGLFAAEATAPEVPGSNPFEPLQSPFAGLTEPEK